MPRKVRDVRIETRTARLKLAPRREPYWCTIQEGRAIGYRRLGGGKAGTWIGRAYSPTHGRRYEALGTADDHSPADGAETLSFGQVQDKWNTRWAVVLGSAAQAAANPLTVREVMDFYLKDYLARGGKALKITQFAVNAHVLPGLGEQVVSELTTETISGWHRGLAEAPARVRSAANGKPRRRTPALHDIDGRRARRATANRVLTILKAALNFAYREGRVASDNTWRRVQPFPKVDAAKVRWLTDDEANRLANACPPDLRILVAAALLTGCRYGDLRSLRSSDIDLANGVLSVRDGKGGRSRHVVLIDEAKALFAPLIASSDRTKPLFLRADGRPWARGDQFRPLRDACVRAKIIPPVGFHALRHSYAESARDERRADGRRRSAARAQRHQTNATALRAFGPRLRR